MENVNDAIMRIDVKTHLEESAIQARSDDSKRAIRK